jgi:hypothetical protein
VADGKNDVEALRKLRFFEELTDDDLARVRRVGHRRRFEAGEAVVIDADPERCGLFMILSGTAKVETGGPPTSSAPATSSGRWPYSDGPGDRRASRRPSRVEALVIETIYYARPGEVLVSQAAVDATGVPELGFAEIGPVELKGVSETMRLWAAHRNT